MIKLKDILLENQAPHPFIPHKIEGRIERQIQQYIKNGSKGDLDLSRRNLTKFPDVLRFINVGGDFRCNNNQLTSLVGAPKSVGGHFWCSFNQLTSLVGAPKSVGGYFGCNDNQLTSLKGAPKSIGENETFNCNDNQLTSLVGAPKSVGGDFYCSHNQLTSLVGAPTSVDGTFYCKNNPVKFTKKNVRSVCDVKGMIFV